MHKMTTSRVLRWSACAVTLGLATLPLPYFRFPINAVALIAGVGIALEGAGSAYGFGLFWFTLFAPRTVLFLRGAAEKQIRLPMDALIVCSSLFVFFVVVGRTLEVSGAKKNWVMFPWIFLSLLLWLIQLFPVFPAVSP
jgi:hypothetical protein